MEQKLDFIAQLRTSYAKDGMELSEDLHTIRITARCLPKEADGLTEEEMEGMTPEEAKQAQEQELQRSRESNWRQFVWHLINRLQCAGQHEAVYMSNPLYQDVEYRRFSDFEEAYWVQCEESESGFGESGWDETMGIRLVSRVPKKLIVEEDHPYLSVRDGVLFNKDQTELIWYPYGRTGETYIVPDGVKKIGCQAFAGYMYTFAAINQDGSRAERLWRKVASNLIDVDDDANVEDVGKYEKRSVRVVKYLFNRALRHVILPDTVTVIEEDAFNHCIFLKSVKLSSTLEEIRSDAFKGCKEMKEISLPDSLKRLVAERQYRYRYGEHFFPDNLERVNFLGVRCQLQPIITGRTWRLSVPYVTEPYTPEFFCRMFQSNRNVTITFEAGNERFYSEDGVIFNKDRTELIYCPRWREGGYTVPGNVVRIGKEAFGCFVWGKCDKLTWVNFAGSSVTDIEDSAFFGCASLQGIDLQSVKRIGNKAFSDCKALAYVDLRDVQHIGDEAFRSCKALADIDLYSVEYIGERAFSECTSLKPELTIPRSCKRMSSHAFSWNIHWTPNTSLKTLRVPQDTKLFSPDCSGGGECIPTIDRY